MDKFSTEKVLASSSGWVASLLNLLPGVGTGYIYQRRWVPYFITSGAVIAWFIIGIILQGSKDPSQTERVIGIAGLFVISIITSVEANLAVKKAIKFLNSEKKQAKPTPKKGWFK